MRNVSRKSLLIIQFLAGVILGWIVGLLLTQEGELMGIGQGWWMIGVWLIVIIIGLIALWKGERNDWQL
jgi:hypothetical protein